jgi:branched-subunit amino acid transport protein
MSALTLGVVLLALMNLTFKAVGPVLLGDRTLPAPAARVLDALGPGLLAALVTTDLLGPHWSAADATILPGLTLAAGLRRTGRSHVLCVAAAVATTCAVRLLF